MSSRAAIDQKLASLRRLLNDSRKYPLEYSSAAKVSIEAQIRDVITIYPVLNVKHGHYMYTDGRAVGMLNLTGVIPVSIQNASYNIPVSLWIPETYPQRPVIAYVNPTTAMTISPNHPHVDSSGFITTPYLTYWTAENSTLLGAIHELQKIFSQKTPVYSKASQPVLSTYAQQNRPVSSTYDQPNQSVNSVYTNPAQSSNQVQGYNPLAQQGGNPQLINNPVVQKNQATRAVQPTARKDNQAMERKYHDVLAQGLIARVIGSLADLETQMKPEIDRLTSEHRVLLENSEQIKASVQSLENERVGLEQNVVAMAAAASEIDAWQTSVHLPSVDPTMEVKPEDAFVPIDPFSDQLLSQQVEDLAAEDALAALDNLFQQEKIDLETYLKQVRKICRNQFHARALVLKIESLQHS